MLIMMFTRGVVFAVGLMSILIGCSQCKPQVLSTSSLSDDDFLDQLDCIDILDTASCLDVKQKNICHRIGPTDCKKTCGLCPKPNCIDILDTASCLDVKQKNVCHRIGPTDCKKTCGLCPKPNIGTLVTDRIVDNSSPINEMGGTASLHTSSTDLSSSTYRCAAVLLNDRYLISAAHCLSRTGKERLTTISLGRENLEETPLPHQIYQINKHYIHSDYVPAVNDYNDIGIIMSERRIEFKETIFPFCLPPRNQVLNDFLYVQIAGWGRVNQTHSSQTLQTNFISIVKNSRCVMEWKALDSDFYESIILQNYPQGLNEKLLCGQRDGVSSCEGDSGGPMTIENSNGRTLVGLISKGVACPRTPVAPIFYTNIANYVDWILEIIGSVNCGGPASSSTATTKSPRDLLQLGNPSHHFGLLNSAPHIATESEIQSSVCSSKLSDKVSDPDPTICDTYYNCVHGIPQKAVCTEGLHFDESTGICNWPDAVNRKNCRGNKQDTFEFPQSSTTIRAPWQRPTTSIPHQTFDLNPGTARPLKKWDAFDFFIKTSPTTRAPWQRPTTSIPHPTFVLNPVPATPLKDSGLCRFISQDRCQDHFIKEQCPNTCKTVPFEPPQHLATTTVPWWQATTSNPNTTFDYDAYDYDYFNTEGECPNIIPTCDPSVPLCSSDGDCAGVENCCFGTCLLNHTCQPPFTIIDIVNPSSQ